MDCFVAAAPPNDKNTHLRSPAARFRPGRAETSVPQEQEGTGNAGCSAAPMARLQQKSRRQSPQVQPGQPAFPARWFYGLYVISPVSGLLATVACSHPASLTPASGGQDHTTLPSALPALRPSAPARPPHPAPRFVTIAIRPSDEARDGAVRPRFPIFVNMNIFSDRAGQAKSA